MALQGLVVQFGMLFWNGVSEIADSSIAPVPWIVLDPDR
jgi:hypothetical protein